MNATYQCRAHAKSTNNRCLKQTPNNLCGTHRSADAVYPVKQLSIPEEKPQEYRVETGSFKGFPTFTIHCGKFYLSFGLKKANAILCHKEDISRFVAGEVLTKSDSISLGSFKGNPVLTVLSPRGEEFSAGASKFKWILDNWTAIQQWVYTLESEPEVPPEPVNEVREIDLTIQKLATIMPLEQAEKIFNLLKN
jgi:hypothetical protein